MLKKETSITTKNFQENFQYAFEPYAISIQKDFKAQSNRISKVEDGLSKVQKDVSKVKEDISEIKVDLSDTNSAIHRIEQRQIADMKRKDDLSAKLDEHEKEIKVLKQKIV